MKGKLQLWFQVLFSMLIALSAVAKGGVCLDGSPPAYHFSPGAGAGINNWLIQIEGGGWCNNATTCLARKNTRLGSSKQMVKQLAFSGILSNKPQFNPVNSEIAEEEVHDMVADVEGEDDHIDKLAEEFTQELEELGLLSSEDSDYNENLNAICSSDDKLFDENIDLENDDDVHAEVDSEHRGDEDHAEDNGGNGRKAIQNDDSESESESDIAYNSGEDLDSELDSDIEGAVRAKKPININREHVKSGRRDVL